MSKLEIFESAMCCPTGVCGVDVDPALVQFNADLQWLTEQGVDIARHNLTHDAAAFVANPAVVKEIEAGMDRLPLVLVDGQVMSTGLYPSRPQLARKLGLRPAANTLHIPIASCGCKPGEC